MRAAPAPAPKSRAGRGARLHGRARTARGAPPPHNFFGKHENARAEIFRATDRVSFCARICAEKPESDSELALQDLVHRLRIGLAAGAPSSPVRQTIRAWSAWLAPARPCPDSSAMISSTAFSIAPVSVTCFMPRASTISAGSPPSRPDDFEQVLGELAGDHIAGNQIDDAADLRGRNRRSLDALAFLVEAAEQFVDHPVGDEFRVAALGGLPRNNRPRRAPAPARPRHRARGRNCATKRAFFSSGNSGRCDASSST